MAWLNQGQGKGAPGQSWNIGSVQQAMSPTVNSQDVNHTEFTPPVWDNNNQAIEANFGGQWDATINEVSIDHGWTVLAGKARGNKDMRPIKSICCSRGNHLHSIERAGNPMKCINEITNDKWQLGEDNRDNRFRGSGFGRPQVNGNGHRH